MAVVLSLVAFPLFFAPSAGAATKKLSYSVTKIQDDKAGFTDLLVSDLSDDGTLVGSWYDAKVEHFRAFSYVAGTFTALGEPEEDGSANAVNENGMVAGSVFRASGDSGGAYACVWKDGKLSDLGSISGTGLGEAFAINTAGDIVGTSEAKDKGSSHATLWKGGKIVDLGTLGGDLSWAYGINDKGQITGYSTLKPGDTSTLHGFLWDKGKMTEIGTLGGDFSSGYRINEKGQVFGYSTTVAGNIFDRPAGRPFVWEKGELKPIGSEGSQVEAINESGLRVGAKGGLATIWINGKPTDLNKLITGADGVSFDLASELNADGFIVLHGTDNSYYLATPKS